VLLSGVLLGGCRPAEHRVPSFDRMRRLEQLLREGVFHLRRRDAPSLRRAQAAFELAHELFPGDPRAIDGLGAVAFYDGARRLAKRKFEEAVAIQPSYARGYVHLALLAEERGDRPEALSLARFADRSLGLPGAE
jgi:hypothetical protein